LIVTNYFKVTRAQDWFFFFDDRIAEDVREAHSRAIATWNQHGGRMSVYRQPVARGFWSNVDVIGVAS